MAQRVVEQVAKYLTEAFGVGPQLRHISGYA
jgi:hypothetical protein